MNDTFVTLAGWVGGEVVLRDGGGAGVVNLRVGSTPRFKRGEEYVDGETTWYTVTVWRKLAENVSRSVQKGDPVIVHGRLRTEVWQRQDGQQGSNLQIEASLVGHDLSRGVSFFTRPPRPDWEQPADPAPNDPEGAAQDWASGLGEPPTADVDRDGGAAA